MFNPNYCWRMETSNYQYQSDKQVEAAKKHYPEIIKLSEFNPQRPLLVRGR